MGKSIDPKGRFKKHLRDRYVSHKQCWISGLKKDGRVPIMAIIQTVRGDGCKEEVEWIKHYREAGADLTNLTDGGEGMAGYKLTDENRLQLRRAHLGKKLSESHIDGMKRAYALLDRTDKQKEQLAELHKRKVGVARPLRVRNILREKCRGWHHSEDTKRNMSQKRLGVPRKRTAIAISISTRETHRNGYDVSINGKPVKELAQANGVVPGVWADTRHTRRRSNAGR